MSVFKDVYGNLCMSYNPTTPPIFMPEPSVRIATTEDGHKLFCGRKGVYCFLSDETWFMVLLGGTWLLSTFGDKIAAVNSGTGAYAIFKPSDSTCAEGHIEYDGNRYVKIVDDTLQLFEVDYKRIEKPVSLISRHELTFTDVGSDMYKFRLTHCS